jgi:pyridoxamine 5'-phosphate oxidase
MTTSYTLDQLIDRFRGWWDEAHATDLKEPAAMVVSSVDARGRPSSRVVLLRQFDARGFVFYTNLESKKGRELLGQGVACLNVHWQPLMKQVRVEGRVERVDDVMADAYFASRARESQLGAWASMQSTPMQDESELTARLAEVTARFAGGPVPRPPHWSGLRIVPDAIEFWSEGAFRLHTRERLERVDHASAVFVGSLLYP